MIRAVFFDLDDTLVDHGHARREAMRDTYERFRAVFHAVPLSHLDTTFDAVNNRLWEQLSLGEITMPELRTQRFLQTLQEVFKLTPLIKYDLRDAFEIDPYFIARYEAHTREMPAATETLRALRERYALGIITNGFRDIQTRRLAALGWTDLVTNVITSDDVGAMKPDAEIFNAAKRAVGAEHEEIALIGDNYEADIRPAKRLGWQTVWFNPGARPSPDGTPGAEVRSLADLASLLSSTE